MRFTSIPALCLAGTLAVFACSSSPAAPGSTTGGATSTGGDATTGAAGSAVAGGGGTDSTGGSGGTPSIADGSAPAADAQSCDAITAPHPSEGNTHTDLCTPLVYLTNPPSSGNHYPVWAVYKTYTKPFLPGFWVHNLEHGAVVITYNCPGGCAAELADAQAFIDALPMDCPAEVNAQKRRIIMLPNPDLDVRFAASAWGFTLKASCFDRAAFAKFYADHYGHGLEPVCDDGYDPLTAATGGTPICP